MLRPLLIATTALLVAVPAANAGSAQNALQPANTYFGTVKSGQHPSAKITVKNVTGHNQTLRRFDLAGAGGNKFTLTWTHATCRLGTLLHPGESCQIVVRVKTTRPEYWQTTVSVYYGRPLAFAHGTRGQFNGSVYAHVVA